MRDPVLDRPGSFVTHIVHLKLTHKQGKFAQLFRTCEPGHLDGIVVRLRHQAHAETCVHNGVGETRPDAITDAGVEV